MKSSRAVDSVLTTKMVYIYDFPELKPGIRAGNMDWMRMPKLFSRKIAAMEDVKQIVVNDPCGIYKSLYNKLESVVNMPVLIRLGASEEIPNGSLSLYFVNIDQGLELFKQDFGLSVGEYGKISIN